MRLEAVGRKECGEEWFDAKVLSRKYPGAPVHAARKEEGRITKNIKSESTKRKMRSRGHCAEIAHPWKELKLRASGKQGLGGAKK